MQNDTHSNKFDLIDKVYNMIHRQVVTGGVDCLDSHETVIYHVWGALGILENGSFQYFFENGYSSRAIADSFDQIDLKSIADSFRAVSELLPRTISEWVWPKQLAVLKKHEHDLDKIAEDIIGQETDIEQSLLDYILRHPSLSGKLNNARQP